MLYMMLIGLFTVTYIIFSSLGWRKANAAFVPASSCLVERHKNNSRIITGFKLVKDEAFLKSWLNYIYAVYRKPMVMFEQAKTQTSLSSIIRAIYNIVEMMYDTCNGDSTTHNYINDFSFQKRYNSPCSWLHFKSFSTKYLRLYVSSYPSFMINITLLSGYVTYSDGCRGKVILIYEGHFSIRKNQVGFYCGYILYETAYVQIHKVLVLVYANPPTPFWLHAVYQLHVRDIAASFNGKLFDYSNPLWNIRAHVVPSLVQYFTNRLHYIWYYTAPLFPTITGFSKKAQTTYSIASMYCMEADVTLEHIGTTYLFLEAFRCSTSNSSFSLAKGLQSIYSMVYTKDVMLCNVTNIAIENIDHKYLTLYLQMNIFDTSVVFRLVLKHHLEHMKTEVEKYKVKDEEHVAAMYQSQNENLVIRQYVRESCSFIKIDFREMSFHGKTSNMPYEKVELLDRPRKHIPKHTKGKQL